MNLYSMQGAGTFYMWITLSSFELAGRLVLPSTGNKKKNWRYTMIVSIRYVHETVALGHSQKI